MAASAFPGVSRSRRPARPRRWRRCLSPRARFRGCSRRARTSWWSHPRSSPNSSASQSKSTVARFEPADLDGAWYVVSAAPPDVNRRVVREAAPRGIFVNAVDDPRHATAFAGSGFRRGPVTVAMSTGGEAPALARLLREALERLVGPRRRGLDRARHPLREDWRRERVPMAKRRDAAARHAGRAAPRTRGREQAGNVS